MHLYKPSCMESHSSIEFLGASFSTTEDKNFVQPLWVCGNQPQVPLNDEQQDKVPTWDSRRTQSRLRGYPRKGKDFKIYMIITRLQMQCIVRLCPFFYHHPVPTRYCSWQPDSIAKASPQKIVGTLAQTNLELVNLHWLTCTSQPQAKLAVANMHKW